MCKDAIQHMKSEIAKVEQQDYDSQDTTPATPLVQWVDIFKHWK